MAAEKTKGVSRTRETVGYIGGLAFVAGVILAVVAGITARNNENVILALVIIGIVVALLNITAKEIVPILVAAVALILAQAGGLVALDRVADGLGRSLQEMVQYFATFMTPVAVISAGRGVVALARPGD